MRKINVFISSAMSELEGEREIALSVIRSINFNPVIFEILPAMSMSPAEVYIEKVRECDIFVLILWKSLRPAVLEEYQEAVKKNKPILVFIKTLIGEEEREQKLTEFINNLMNPHEGVFTKGLVFKYFRSLTELEKALKESVAMEIAKYYEEPIHTLSRQEMYELGVSIIRFAQRRLYIYQKTPTLFLGARDYLAPQESKYTFEKDFYNSLENWIEKNKSLPDKELIYMFSIEETRAEMDNLKLRSSFDYIEELKNRIEKYKKIENEGGYRFRFAAMESISGPLVVGDNRYELWFLGHEETVCISQENEKICDIIGRMVRIHSSRRIDAEELLSKLEI